MRRTELTRKTFMPRGKGFARPTPEDKPAVRRTAAKVRAKYTGPSADVRKLVRERDEDSCVVCGVVVAGRPWSIHHRRNRGMGGSSDPGVNAVESLLLVCGTGTTGCHGVITERPWEIDAERNGWVIGRNSIADPAGVPVVVAWLGPCLPTRDGSWVRCEEIPAGWPDPSYGSPSDLDEAAERAFLAAECANEAIW
ncbi:hypothetical protein IMZ11_02750 [Microtetraspora sp. AC03309]|uniref:hypothetical protein n=1 Tax=Microtetraspora sp. AC03309 TaxID=2779376 RepID=UPI001E543842|nr:hypothetical protein [Microtetraspora sp. AC03309]MCC5574559.1 hypothetical protein [Microtetraspora sp. AC03309]